MEAPIDRSPYCNSGQPRETLTIPTLTEHIVQADHQHDFRKQRSTTTSLQSIHLVVESSYRPAFSVLETIGDTHS